jgi:hypothetical protein
MAAFVGTNAFGVYQSKASDDVRRMAAIKLLAYSRSRKRMKQKLEAQ